METWKVLAEKIDVVAAFQRLGYEENPWSGAGSIHEEEDLKNHEDAPGGGDPH